ncbi:MAG TPA: AzlD domain-containing protein [Marmoricola sp.]
MIWAAIVVAGVGSYLFKLAGLSIPSRYFEHPVATRIVDALPVALLAALLAVQVFATGDRDGQHLVVDARAAGLVVAAVALLLRAPFLVVVVLAAATAALLRLWG